MPLIAATVLTIASTASPLAQGELVKFVLGNASPPPGCGVIWYSAEFEAVHTNGDKVKLYLSCPEMAPTVPRVGDVCRVTYEVGPIEVAFTEEVFSNPEGDVMIIKELDCGSHLARPDIWN
jgi:hypothetical protein